MKEFVIGLKGVYSLVLLMVLVMLIPTASAAYLKEEWEKQIVEEESINDAFGLCVGDIDGDGTQEIIAGNDESTITVFDGKTKETEWEIKISDLNLDITSIRTGNLDDDASAELAVGLAGWSGGFAVIDVQTQTVEYLNTSIDATDYLLVIDHSSTSFQEILVGGGDHVFLFGYNGTDYYEVWVSPELEGDINTLAWGNFDTDAENEIIAGFGVYDLDSFSYTGGITVFSDDLEQKWNKTDFQDNVLSLCIHETHLYIGTGQTGDGLLDYNGWLYVFSGENQIKGTDLNMEVEAVVFGDITGDEAEEIVIGNEDTVVVFSQDMKELGSGNYYSHSGANGNLFVVDVDDDGKNEIIVYTNSYSSGNYVYILIPGGATDPTNETSSSADFLLGSMCIAVCCGLFIIDILIMIWVYKDAESRGESGAKWLVIVLFTGIIGIIIWLVVRPKTRSYGTGYSGSSYSGGRSFEQPKGKGKVVVGAILLIVGLIIFMLIIPQTTVTPTEYKEEYDDAEEGSTWTVHGHLTNKESLSLAGTPIYFYSFEEDEEANFSCSEDFGDDGDEVIVTLEKTMDDLNQAEATLRVSPWVYKGPGIFFATIGIIVLIIGASQVSKGSGSGRGSRKGRKGEHDGAGNVDVSGLLAGPGGPSMDPSTPTMPPTMMQQSPQAMQVQGIPQTPMQQQFHQSPQPNQFQQPGLPQGYQQMQPPAGPPYPTPFQQPGMPQGQQQMQPSTAPPQPNQFQQPGIPAKGPQHIQQPIMPIQGPQQGQHIPVQNQAPPQPMTPQYQAATWTCPNCGISMNAEYSFCTSCGHGKGL